MLYFDGREVKGFLFGEEFFGIVILRGVFFLFFEYLLFVEKCRDFVGERVRFFDFFGDIVECFLDLIFLVFFLSFFVDFFFSCVIFLFWYNELWKFLFIFIGFGLYID